MPNSRITKLMIYAIIWHSCCLTSQVCESLRFELQSGSAKCIAEEIKHDAMTVGKYDVISPIDGHPVPDSHRITARLTSPQGNNYHYKELAKSGTFSFTAPDTGDYMICFLAPYHDSPTKIPIEFEWKTGVDAKDWYNIARKGQIDLLDIELRRLYDTVQSIHDDMFYLREREEEMQLLNKSTNSKMAIFGLFSLIVVTCVATIQLWHLKEYFERKKLL